MIAGLMLVMIVLLTGCGKTVDQVKATLHQAIEIGGAVYQDVSDNAVATKEALKEMNQAAVPASK